MSLVVYWTYYERLVNIEASVGGGLSAWADMGPYPGVGRVVDDPRYEEGEGDMTGVAIR